MNSRQQTAVVLLAIGTLAIVPVVLVPKRDRTPEPAQNGSVSESLADCYLQFDCATIPELSDDELIAFMRYQPQRSIKEEWEDEDWSGEGPDPLRDACRAAREMAKRGNRRFINVIESTLAEFRRRGDTQLKHAMALQDQLPGDLYYPDRELTEAETALQTQGMLASDIANQCSQALGLLVSLRRLQGRPGLFRMRFLPFLEPPKSWGPAAGSRLESCVMPFTDDEHLTHIQIDGVTLSEEYRNLLLDSPKPLRVTDDSDEDGGLGG